jgi:hypothetical protein
MRKIILGFCLFAAGCAGSETKSPGAPSPSSGGPVATEARAGTELPFSGTLETVETHQFQPPNFIVAHLEGKGIASHLGRFTSVSDFTINTVTAMGAGTLTLTAANGDQLFATVTGEAVGGTPDRLQIDETFTITGGTGRFTGASGSFTSTRFADTTTVPRIPSSGSFEGTIDLNR